MDIGNSLVQTCEPKTGAGLLECKHEMGENEKNTNSCCDVRYRISKEILDSERKYCSSLSTLINHFSTSIEKANVVSEDTVGRMIPVCLREIYSIHCQFLHQLERKLISAQNLCPTGQLFQSVLLSSQNLFQEYMEYFGKFSQGVSLIQQTTEQNPAFKEILQLLQSHSCCEGLDIGAFLLTPIQRIPRYVLLFKQLLTNTDKSDDDHVAINGCVTQLTDFLSKLNSPNSAAEPVSSATTVEPKTTDHGTTKSKRSVMALHLSRLSFRTGSVQERSGSRFSRPLVSRYKIGGKENRLKPVSVLSPLSTRVHRVSPRHSFRVSHPSSLQRLPSARRGDRATPPALCLTPKGRQLSSTGSKLFNRSARKRQLEELSMSRESLGCPEPKNLELDESVADWSGDKEGGTTGVRLGRALNDVDVRCSPVARLFISDRNDTVDPCDNVNTNCTTNAEQNVIKETAIPENRSVISTIMESLSDDDHNDDDDTDKVPDVSNEPTSSDVGVLTRKARCAGIKVSQLSISRRSDSYVYSNSCLDIRNDCRAGYDSVSMKPRHDYGTTDESDATFVSCLELGTSHEGEADLSSISELVSTGKGHFRRSSCDGVPSKRNSLLKNLPNTFKFTSHSSTAVGFSSKNDQCCSNAAHAEVPSVQRKNSVTMRGKGLSRKVSIKDSIMKLFHK